MKIKVITIGSRGDIQPFVALTRGLSRAGYAAQLIAPPDMLAMGESYGIDFIPAGHPIRETLERSDARQTLQSGNILRFVRQQQRWSEHLFGQFYRDIWAACQDADAIVYKRAAIPGFSIAHKLGIPAIEIALQPYTPTAAFPPLFMGRPPINAGWFNRAAHHVTNQAVWQMMRRNINRFRQDQLDLPPYPFNGPFRQMANAGLQTLYAISPSVIPRPDDWPQSAHLTGYFFLNAPDDWTPPDDLRRFLAAGDPPIYIGFGSMTSENPREMVRLVLDALERTGQRGIVASGWNGLGDVELPDTVFALDHAPHSWLFPRMRAVVHHGGAGTTAAGFRAGVPSILIPHNADQPFWGQRVADLRVGAAPILRRDLSADALANAITQVIDDPAIGRNAQILGDRIRAEDGVGQAVDHIERIADTRIETSVMM